MRQGRFSIDNVSLLRESENWPLASLSLHTHTYIYKQPGFHADWGCGERTSSPNALAPSRKARST